MRKGIRFTRLLPLGPAMLLLCLGSLKGWAGDLEVAEGLFYNDQYKKAISSFIAVLKDPSRSKAEKTEINYKIGLSYFMLGDMKSALEFWSDAKRENPGIFDGKIFRIPSPGMEPELIVGDHIIVDNEYYKHKTVQRADVVTFLSPEDPNKVYLKRIIGMPGEELAIRKREIFVNGRKLFDKYAHFSEREPYNAVRDDFRPIVIPARSYFLLGDNRDKSFDSRFFGTVSENLIIGKALVIYGTAPHGDSLEGATLNRTGRRIK